MRRRTLKGRGGEEEAGGGNPDRTKGPRRGERPLRQGKPGAQGHPQQAARAAGEHPCAGSREADA